MGKHRVGVASGSVYAIPGNYKPLNRRRKTLRTLKKAGQSHTAFPLLVSAFAATVALLGTEMIGPPVVIAEAVPAQDTTPTFPVPAPSPSNPTPQKPTQSAPKPSVSQDPKPTTRTPQPTKTIKPPVVLEAPLPTPKATPKAITTPKPIDLNVETASMCRGIGILSAVIASCSVIANALPQIDDIGGRADRSNPSCHPLGLALDLMVSSNAEGDAVAAFVRKNKEALGISTILWEVPNHFDHVHVSFLPCTH